MTKIQTPWSALGAARELSLSKSIYVISVQNQFNLNHGCNITFSGPKLCNSRIASLS